MRILPPQFDKICSNPQGSDEICQLAAEKSALIALSIRLDFSLLLGKFLQLQMCNYSLS